MRSLSVRDFLILILVGILCQFGASATQCRLAPPKKLNVNTNSPSSTSTSKPTGTGQNNDSTGGPKSSATAAAFQYGQNIIRGVNLGGWFVLEPWITPSFFEETGNDAIIDEFTLGQYMNRNDALGMLEKHWQTWYTEDDFAAMSAAGLNHVRIPLGYWSVPLTSGDTSEPTYVDPYIPGAWPYFLQALQWAKKYNINVIVDIHGAPGSQNGYDNSGQRTDNPAWWLNQSNVTRTLDTVKYVIKNAGQNIDVIELLNEPAAFRGGTYPQVIRQFWSDGYNVVRNTVGDNMKVMIGDAFLGVQNWNGFLTYPGAQGVMMDFHEYQIFSHPELSRSFDDHVQYACTYLNNLSSYKNANIWTVIGEWSTAVTDCAKWLNGRGVGARWDNTWNPSPDTYYHGSCANYTGSWQGFSNDYKTFLRRYWEVQTEIGEALSGWVYWTWKAENADDWSYQKGLEGGWIPKDPTQRLYPHTCTKQ